MQKKLCGLSIIFVVIDQILKIIVSNNIKLNTEIDVIKNILYITNVHNEGAAFSIFSGNIIFLIFITIISLVIIYLFFIKNKKLNNIEILLDSMLIGGIIGNFIDRIVYRYVIDYIGVMIIDYPFPIFNFADICIVLSVIGMCIYGIKEDLCKKSESKKKLVE